jgi:hypothetical protein
MEYSWPINQGLCVYPKYPYCMLAALREASAVEDEKDAIRVNAQALLDSSDAWTSLSFCFILVIW